jgi:hypothetical protein
MHRIWLIKKLSRSSRILSLRTGNGRGNVRSKVKRAERGKSGLKGVEDVVNLDLSMSSDAL